MAVAQQKQAPLPLGAETMLPAALEIAAIEDRRQASPSGFFVEPSVPIEQINALNLSVAENRQLVARVITTWLDEIVAAGGTDKDVWRAWVAWKPINAAMKYNLQSHWDALDRKAKNRETELLQRRNAEQLPIRRLQTLRSAMAGHDRRVADVEAELARVKAERSKLMRAIAEAEAQAAEHVKTLRGGDGDGA